MHSVKSIIKYIHVASAIFIVSEVFFLTRHFAPDDLLREYFNQQNTGCYLQLHMLIISYSLLTIKFVTQLCCEDDRSILMSIILHHLNAI